MQEYTVEEKSNGGLRETFFDTKKQALAAFDCACGFGNVVTLYQGKYTIKEYMPEDRNWGTC